MQKNSDNAKNSGECVNPFDRIDDKTRDASDDGLAQLSFFDEVAPEQPSYVGFSTGDAELDLLLSEKNELTQSVDFKASFKTTNADIEGANEKSAETDDSYYGTIKPIAENAGVHCDEKNIEVETLVAATEKTAIQSGTFDDEITSNEKRNENVEKALNKVKPQAIIAVNSLKNTITRVYDEVFKNNSSFKSSLESIIKNFEEYVQALLLSTMLDSGITYEGFPDFVYEILPEGDIFENAESELMAKITITEHLKKHPTAVLMLAAVDVSFNKTETKKLLNEIYGLYCTCVCALGIKANAKEEILFNLISFAKNQGVNI